MRDTDIKVLLNFLSRMGMYVCPGNRGSVVSFLTGYELGTDGNCIFTDFLSKKLEDKYHVEKYATGWPDQIERYAKKSEIDWMQGFHLIASEVLNDSISH